MIEVKVGVFVGCLTSRVRDELWEAAVKGCKSGSCLQLWDAPSEQGYHLRSFGDTSYRPVDLEGLLLIKRPLPEVTRSPMPPDRI
jgi:CRISPR-associated protein Cas2